MNKLISAVVATIATTVFADAVITINNVVQPNLWEDDVNINYTVSGVEEPENTYIRFTLKENRNAEPITLTEFDTTSTLTEASNGTYSVVWKSSREADGHFFSRNAVVTAELVYAPGGADMPYNTFKDYLVVDLSGGTKADEFPITHLTMSVDEATNYFNTVEYKTTKLVLRRVKACTFEMGEDTQSYYTPIAAETKHMVTLTKDFFIGIYEVTEKQYELVMGTSAGSNPTHPVVNVTCNNMRGDTGPVLEEPTASSFFGVLSAKTGLCFDSPYEAQWECACKAGTNTVWYTGYDQVDGEYAEPLPTIAWNQGNASSAQEVGTRLPNAWGIYDMVGNVWEWCRDGAVQDLGSDAVTNPTGDDTLSSRVGKGGSFKYGVHFTHPTVRTIENNYSYHDEVGFRASLTID